MNRQLKGNALGLVIEKIGEIASGAEVGHGIQGNKVALVLYEVLAMFEVMMRQLKVTQKELKRARRHQVCNAQSQQQHGEAFIAKEEEEVSRGSKRPPVMPMQMRRPEVPRSMSTSRLQQEEG